MHMKNFNNGERVDIYFLELQKWRMRQENDYTSLHKKTNHMDVNFCSKFFILNSNSKMLKVFR